MNSQITPVDGVISNTDVCIACGAKKIDGTVCSGNDECMEEDTRCCAGWGRFCCRDAFVYAMANL